MKNGFWCAFEVPPHTKVCVVATVERKLCEEMDRIHLQEIERERAEDRTEPDWRKTLEMLMRKGVRSNRSNHKGQAYFLIVTATYLLRFFQ